MGNYYVSPSLMGGYYLSLTDGGTIISLLLIPVVLVEETEKPEKITNLLHVTMCGVCDNSQNIPLY
jgi:hypothetical protein